MYSLIRSNEFKLHGYCINCKSQILYDVNKPLCSGCYDFLGANLKTGIYCHLCGKSNKIIDKFEPRCINCRPFSRDNNYPDNHYIKLLAEFKDIVILKQNYIKPLWSYDHETSYTLEEIETSEILKIIESNQQTKLNTNEVFCNEVRSNARIISILMAWRNGLCIEIPKLEFDSQINYIEGRHRVIAAHYLGEKIIPLNISLKALYVIN